jgi:hypothetical protein
MQRAADDDNVATHICLRSQMGTSANHYEIISDATIDAHGAANHDDGIRDFLVTGNRDTAANRDP